jgi:hypothetical protein
MSLQELPWWIPLLREIPMTLDHEYSNLIILRYTVEQPTVNRQLRIHNQQNAETR